MARGQRSEVGATRISPNGYHYTNTEDRGWILTHRLIAEKKLGRQLHYDERVKFIDGDRTNLDPDNLEVNKVGKKSPARRRAQIEARIEEYEARIAELKRELSEIS